MKNKLLLLTTAFLLWQLPALKAQNPYITVDDTYTYEDLIQDVLLQGTACAEVSNIVGITGTDFNSTQGIGYFENENPVFDMENGIVLATGGISTTGTTQGVEGPTNNVTFPGGGTEWPADPQLTNYLVANQNTAPGGSTYYNASILEFDFTSFTDSISFNFIFASNEYGTFQCSYSDSFAFFLEDSGGTVTNLAVLKDTNGNIIPGIGGDETPISVLTIRDNAHNTGCPSANDGLFDTYWGPNNASAPINLLGQTVKLQAWSYVVPFQTYRMKLVVQDRGDSSYDSAVFIEGGSFFLGNVDLGGDITFDSPDSDCLGSAIELSIDEFAGCAYTWYYEDEVIAGADTNVYLAELPGIYRIEVDCGAGASGCLLTDEIFVEFRVTPDLSPSWDGDVIRLCDPDFSIILVGTPDNLEDLNQITYSWYQNGILLPSTGSTYTVTEPGTYNLIVSELGCSGLGTITIEVTPDFEVDLGGDVDACDVTEYLLVADVTGNIDLNDVTYLWSTGETTSSILVSNTDSYSVEVTYQGCTEESGVFVALAESPEVTLGDNIQKCPNEEVTITAQITNSLDGNLTYTWYYGGGQLPDTTPSISVTDNGIYRVEVDNEGCSAEAEIEVMNYQYNVNCVISQGISPNGSPGQNDILDLEFLANRTGIELLQIFNRHGLVVYEKTNYVNEWEGQSDNGDELPSGTYYYVLNFSGDDSVYGNQTNGWIYINRGIN